MGARRGFGDVLLAGRDPRDVEAELVERLATHADGAELWVVDGDALRRAGRGRRRVVTLSDPPDTWPDRWTRQAQPADLVRLGSADAVFIALRATGATWGVLVAPGPAARRLAALAPAVAVQLANLGAVRAGRAAADLEELDRALLAVASDAVALPEALEQIEGLIGHGVELLDDFGGTSATRVEAGDVVFGWLATEADLDAHGRDRLERAGSAVALYLQRERAVTQARHQLRGEFLREVIASDGTATRTILARGVYLGVDLARPLAVVFFMSEGDRDIEDLRGGIERVVERLVPRGLVAAWAGGGVMLAPGHEPRTLANEFSAQLDKELDAVFTVGFAPEAVGIGGVGDAVEEARRAVHGARTLGRAGAVACRDDLGLYGSIVAADDGELGAAAARLLAPLIAYDDRQGTDLIGSLAAYLEAGGNVTEAARRLIIHANSLYYRLGRIRELTGYELDDPDVRFELQLALRVIGSR